MANTTSGRLWVLGAADPEMALIETLLREAGEEIALAMCQGKRCHPGNAYKMDALSVPVGGRREVVWVECAPAPGSELAANVADMAEDGWDFRVVDHHRPGDPGYGKPPERYLHASSIGQVLILLDKGLAEDCSECRGTGEGPYGECPNCGGTGQGRSRPDADVLRMTSAADHCLEAAYRGRCPGVDPARLLAFRAESRAAFQKRPIAEVLNDIGEARRILRESALHTCEDCGGSGRDQYDMEVPCQYCGGEPLWKPYADLRGRGVNSLPIPELPEAACREGIAYLTEVTDPDGRRKVVLGAAGPELVERFLAGKLVPGLTGHYGDPARGFAGGYLS